MQDHDDVLRRLSGTPYLIYDSPDEVRRFRVVAERARTTRVRSIRVAAEIRKRTRTSLTPFAHALRSTLVAESNRLEGFQWTGPEVSELVRVHQDLLQLEVHNFMESVRHDRRLIEGLGLYRAYQVADEWARSDQRPREFEVRALHELITTGESFAGRYKTSANVIGGSSHVPSQPWDVALDMQHLVDWWQTGSGDPVLDATIVHAWLTHIHPFDDGNGRVARLLANLTLVQSRYPPLLLRSDADRGQYLDALVASDEGDILPLYDLFVTSLRKTVKTMERPDYVRSVIDNRLLGTIAQRYGIWRGLAAAFLNHLVQKVRKRGHTARLMGVPGELEFQLLTRASPEGNCWFLMVGDGPTPSDASWLLWFGVQTPDMRDLVKERSTMWPSIYFAERSRDPTDVRPFVNRPGAGRRYRPSEITLVPGEAEPVIVRWDWECHGLGLDSAAELVATALCPNKRLDAEERARGGHWNFLGGARW